MALTTHPHLAPRLKKEYYAAFEPSWPYIGRIKKKRASLQVARPDESRFDSRQDHNVYLQFKVGTVDVGRTQTVSEASKRPALEANHSSPHLIAKTKNKHSSNSTPSICLHYLYYRGSNFERAGNRESLIGKVTDCYCGKSIKTKTMNGGVVGR